jgi:UDP-glucose 4-epimerase
MKILVTGGAGYIGSHVVRELAKSGYEPVALDDLSSGLIARLGQTPLVQVDLAGPSAKVQLVELFQDHQIQGVIHLAARKAVAESVARPDFYYQQNVGAMLNLLGAMHEAGVKNLVFSSSAATYGSPDQAKVGEDYQCQPINPYGETKLIGEWLVANAVKAWGLNGVSLRYFNVAGAGFDDLGDTSVANLIPIAINAYKSKTPVQVFGTDWPTADGSCVRDYIHVADLTEAHIKALGYLENANREHLVFNVGSGEGSSVIEVISALSEVVGEEVLVNYADRRPGDPAVLAADVSRINQVLGWKAKHNLHEIVESAYRASLN